MTSRIDFGRVTMSGILRAIAVVTFWTAFLTLVESVRRILTDVLFYGSTPARLSFFGVLACVGLLG